MAETASPAPDTSASGQAHPRSARRLPLWLKLIVAVFACVYLPAYWHHHGPLVFLWYSNIAMLLMMAGILLESPLLISMAAVGVLLPETGWTVDLLARLALRRPAFGFTEYFFSDDEAAWVRALTLYHLALPPMLWWLTGRLGFDRRALASWLALAAVAAVLAMLISDPQRNINRLWGFGAQQQTALPRWLFLVLWSAIALALWTATHLALAWLRNPPPGRGASPEAAASPAGVSSVTGSS